MCITIIKGDFSGIQEYIFNVKTKGAAKNLKLRSSEIQELEKKYLKKLKETLGTDEKTKNEQWNDYQGGGGFFAICESNEILTGLDSILEKVEKEFKKETKDLLLRLTYASEVNYETAWSYLVKENNRKRYQSLDGIDEDDFQRMFYPFQTFDKIIKTEYIELKEKYSNYLPKWDSSLLKLIEEFKANNPEKELSENYTKGGIIEFDALAHFAEERTGSDFLGVLKMDIDNLGTVFKNKIEGVKQFEKINQFFNGFFLMDSEKEKSIRNIIKNKCFKEKQPDTKNIEDKCDDIEYQYKNNVYTVFSGGDDCFFIGAWDAILPFALEIQKTFKDAKKGIQELNDVSLSAGISLVNAKTPVVRISEITEEYLSNAKKHEDKDGDVVKDAVCIMDEVFSWNNYETALKHSETIQKMLEKEIIKKSFLGKIKRSAKGFNSAQKRIERGEKLPLEQVWRLKYYLRDMKTQDDKSKQELVDEMIKDFFTPYENALIETITSEGKLKTNPMQFPLAARITELKTRKKENNESEKYAKTI
ncbi:Cas10/Cmr2 second palm domain-containing protein [Aureivirga sp. CE67]|uniref:Cas10/Cmr2 second palm domain-containing protein n=1 Tax=Aureivirga sp. CE67 TaxID=1788983 RepID=UPI0018CA9812|nr:hypothetical protein [Aureivirga sp. CE67]